MIQLVAVTVFDFGQRVTMRMIMVEREMEGIVLLLSSWGIEKRVQVQIALVVLVGFYLMGGFFLLSYFCESFL